MVQLYWQYSKAVYRLNGAILDRFLELALQHDFEPVIIFLPGRGDTKKDVQRRTWLRDYAEEHAAPFLDLSADIHALPRDSLFIYQNWHLNPRGHRVVAERLLDFLEEHGWFATATSSIETRG